MNILLFTILTGGLLVFLSQTSYARVIAKVDFTTAERRVHCIHHTAHAFCGILAMLTAVLLMIEYLSAANAVCMIAGLLLIADAVAFIILDKTRHFSMRRDVIKRKWQNEKVFGPGHDSEVSVYRTLKEITCKNLLRDGLHLTLFVVLFLLG